MEIDRGLSRVIRLGRGRISGEAAEAGTLQRGRPCLETAGGGGGARRHVQLGTSSRMTAERSEFD